MTAPQTLAPIFPVLPPVVRPAVGGLITYADKPANDGVLQVLVPGGNTPPQRPEAWEAGFAFDPYTCDPAIVVPFDCDTPFEYPVIDGMYSFPAPKLEAIGDHPGIVTYIPFSLVAADECTDLSFENLEERARAMLNVSQSFTLEQEFWTGAAMPTNPNLTDGSGITLGSGALTDLQEALALLDQALSASEQGAPGMLHMTPYMLAWIVNTEGGAVHWAGDRYVTANGHTIVPGSGYTGGGPRSMPTDPLPPTPPDLLSSPPDNQWIYATGQAVVRLGNVINITPDGPSQLNKANNRQRFIFERSAAAYYSPCSHFQVEIDLTPTP